MVQRTRDFFIGAAALAVFAILLFLVFINLKYVILLLAMYSLLLLTADLVFLVFGEKKQAWLIYDNSYSERFYEDDEYGFRRHPDVKAPDSRKIVKGPVAMGYWSLSKGAEESVVQRCSVPLFMQVSGVPGNFDVYLVCWFPSFPRRITIFSLILHSLLPLLFLAAMLADRF